MKADVQPQQDVMAVMKCDPSVLAEQIGAEVQDGVVTLTGERAASPKSGRPKAPPSATPASRRGPWQWT